MATVAALDIRVRANTRDAQRGLGALRKSVGGIARIAAAGTAAAVAVTGGLAAAGLKEFRAFDKGIREVYTLLPGLSKEAYDDISKQARDFSRQTGAELGNVVGSLYQAISAGVPRNNVFDFLETAQRAAVGGVSDLTTSVDALTSVTNAYGKEVLSTGQASDIFFATIREGKTDFSQLGAVIGRVTPLAAGLGVPFDQVGASIAALTAQGINTAESVTGLRAVFTSLAKPVGEAEEILDKVAARLGHRNIEQALRGEGLPAVLEAITRASGGTVTGLNMIFGSVEAANAVLALTSTSGAAKLTQALEATANAAGGTDAAFKVLDESLDASLNRFRSARQVLFANIGEQIAPDFKELVDFVVGDVMPRVERAVVGGFRLIAEAFRFFTRNPLSRLIDSWRSAGDQVEAEVTGIRRVVFGLVDVLSGAARIISTLWLRLVVPAWERVAPVLGRILEGLVAVTGAALERMGQGLSDFADFVDRDWGLVWMDLRTVAAEGLAAVGETLRSAWQGFVAFLTRIWMDLRTRAMEIWSGLRDTIAGLTGPLAAVWDVIASAATAAFEVVSPIAAKLAEIAVDVADRVVATFTRAVDAIKSVFSTINERLIQPIRRFFGLEDAVTSQTASLRDLGNQILDSGPIQTKVTTSLEDLTEQQSRTIGVLDELIGQESDDQWLRALSKLRGDVLRGQQVQLEEAVTPDLSGAMDAAEGLNQIGEGVRSAWEEITSRVGAAWEEVGAVAGAALGTIQNLASATWAAITAGAATLAGILAGIWTGVQLFAGQAWSAVSGAAAATWAAITAGAATLAGVLAGIWPGVQLLAGQAWSAVSGAAAATWAAITAGAATLAGILAGIWTGVQLLAGQAWSAVSGAAAATWAAITAGAATLAGILAGIWTGVQLFAGQAWSAVSGAAAATWAAITAGAATLAGVLAGIWPGVQLLAGQAWSAVSGAAAATWAAITAGAATLAGVLAGIWPGVQLLAGQAWSAVSGAAAATWAAITAGAATLAGILAGIWTGVQLFAGQAWSAVSGAAAATWAAITAGAATLAGVLAGIWPGVQLLAGQAWSAVSGAAAATWAAITAGAATLAGVLAGIWPGVQLLAGQAWSAVSGAAAATWAAITAGAATLAGVLAGIWPGVQLLAGQAWSAVSGAAAATWAAITAGAATLAGILAGIWTGVQLFAGQAWSAVSGAAAATWAAITAGAATLAGVLAGIWPGVQLLAGQAWSAVSGAAAATWAAITAGAATLAGILAGIWTGVQLFAGQAWSAVSGAAAATWAAITAGAATLAGVLAGIWPGVQLLAGQAWSAVSGAAAATWAAITAGAATLAGVLAGVWTAVTTAAGTAWSAVSGAAADAVAVTIGLISSIAESTVWAGIVGTAHSSWRAISSLEVWAGVLSDIRGYLGLIPQLQVWRDIGSVGEAVATAIGAAFETAAGVIEAALGVASDAWDALASSVQAGLDGITSAIQTVSNALSNIPLIGGLTGGAAPAAATAGPGISQRDFLEGIGARLPEPTLLERLSTGANMLVDELRFGARAAPEPAPVAPEPVVAPEPRGFLQGVLDNAVAAATTVADAVMTAVTPEPSSDLRDLIQESIAIQESGGDYSAVNFDSGALGRYQVLAENLTGALDEFDQKFLGRDITPAAFLADPAAQDTLMRNRLDYYLSGPGRLESPQYGLSGLTDEDRVAYAAARQYGFGGQSMDQLVTAFEQFGSPLTALLDDTDRGGYPSTQQYAEEVLEHFRNLSGLPDQPRTQVRGSSTEMLTSLPSPPPSIVDPAAPDTSAVEEYFSRTSALTGAQYASLVAQRFIPGSQALFGGARAGVRSIAADPAAGSPEATAGAIATAMGVGGQMLAFELVSALADPLAQVVSSAAEDARTAAPDTFAAGAAGPVRDFFSETDRFTAAADDVSTILGESLSFGAASSARALESLTETLRRADRLGIGPYGAAPGAARGIGDVRGVAGAYPEVVSRRQLDTISPFTGLDDEVVGAGLASLETSVSTLDEITKRDEPLYQRLGEAGVEAAREGVKQILDSGILQALPTAASLLARGGLAAGQSMGRAFGAGAERGLEFLTSDEGRRAIAALGSGAEAIGRVGQNIGIGSTRELLGGDSFLARGILGPQDQGSEDLSPYAQEVIEAFRSGGGAANTLTTTPDLRRAVTLATRVGDIVTPTFQAVQTGANAVGEGIDAVSDHLSTRFSAAADELGAAGSKVVGFFTSLVRRNVPQIGDDFEDQGRRVDASLSQVATASELSLSRVTTAAEITGPATRTAMVGSLVDGEGAMVPSVLQGVGYMTDGWSQALATLGPTAGSAGLESSEALLGPLVDGEGALVPSVVAGLGLLEGSWGTSMDVITAVAAQAADSASASASRAIAAAQAAAEAARDASRGSSAPTTTRVPVFPRGPGRSTETQVSITAGARGGITTGPTLALIGEDGPEALVPLDGLTDRLREAFASALAEQARRGAGSERPLVIRVDVDGRELARRLVPRIPDVLGEAGVR